MATISLCMIVRDEEPVLARCLQSVRDAVDEIILVDTGSVDRTVEVAMQFTDKVHTFPWVDDFAAARNFAFSKASMDYQMWLDADDVIAPEDCRALLALKQDLTADVVMLPYHVSFDASGRPTFSYERERLFRRACGFTWEGAVHETITPRGVILHASPAVCHKKEHVNDPNRNLRILERLRTGRSLTPREQFYYARELFYHDRCEEALTAFREFLQAPDGWYEDRISACLTAARCCRKLGRTGTAQAFLCSSFIYALPRAEILCELGSLLLEQGRVREAVYWYEQALAVPLSPLAPGFQEPDCHDYIPLMQLCVCYDRLGNLEKACAYNERAGRIKPEDVNVLANRRYFRDQLRSSTG
ncbi:MAG: glycosyltransferase [Oscillospiraceae bacterium]|nr:glycosyltransferase [Oscillospiraceae bacterium]